MTIRIGNRLGRVGIFVTDDDDEDEDELEPIEVDVEHAEIEIVDYVAHALDRLPEQHRGSE